MASTYNGKETVKGVFGNIVKNNPELSDYLKNLYKSVGWTDSNPHNGIGFTVYSGMNTPPKIHVSENRIFGILASEENLDAMAMLEKKVNASQTFDDMLTREQLNKLKNYYDGVLMHEVAHIASDDALCTLVTGAMTDTRSGYGDIIDAAVERARKAGENPDNAKLSKEDVSTIKKNVRDIIANRKDITLTPEEYELIDQYVGIRATTLPIKAISTLSAAHNYIIDIYIENSLPNVIPNDPDGASPYHTLRSRTREAIDAVRKAINDPDQIRDLEEVKKNAESNNIEFLLSKIIQPYIDGRCNVDLDLRSVLDQTSLGEVLKEKAPKGTVLKFQPDKKDIDGFDILKELRLVNKENRRISLSMTDEQRPLKYTDRVEKGIDAGYYTAVYNVFIKAIEKEFMRIDETMDQYYEMLKKVKELVEKAEKLEKDANIKSSLDEIAKMLPNYSTKSATELQDILKEARDATQVKGVPPLLDEAIDILEDLKYEVQLGGQGMTGMQQNLPPLPPDKVSGQPQPQQNQQNQQQQQSQGQGQQGQENQQQQQNQGQQQNQQGQQGQQQQGQQQGQQQQGQQQGGQQSQGQQGQQQQGQGQQNDLSDSAASSGAGGVDRSESKSEASREQGGNSGQQQGQQQRGNERGGKDQKAQNKGDKGDEQGQEQGEGDGNAQDVSDYNDKKGKSTGERLKEALEKQKGLNDNRDIDEVAKDLGEHNTFGDKANEEALENAIKDTIDEVEKMLDEINDEIAKDMENLPQGEEKLDKNFLKDVKRVSELTAEKRDEFLQVNNDGYEFIGKNIKLTGGAKAAYDYIKVVLDPVLQDSIKEIEKSLKPVPDAAVNFYSGTERSIADAAVETKLTGKLKTNQIAKPQFFSADIDIVVDTSGSMGSGLSFIDHNGDKVSVTNLDLAKAFISSITENMAMFGITINVYTFESHPAEKAFSTTFSVNPTKDAFGFKEERASKISEMNDFLNHLNANGGTYQLSAVTAAIDNGLNEYLLSKSNPERLPSDKRALLRQTNGKIPSKVSLLITDDFTWDYDQAKEKVVAKMLNASPICDNFFATRLIGNQDANGYKLEEFFQGFPISPEYGRHAAVVANYNGFNVTENIAIAAKGIGGVIASTVKFDLNPNSLSMQEAAIRDLKMDRAAKQRERQGAPRGSGDESLGR